MSDTTSNCFNFLRQEFLVCTTIHKARNLCVFNADTYVKVTLDKKSKITKVFQNSESPYFNEYFVFETFCTLNELLRLTILFQIFKRNRCRKDTSLGELFIDLTTVWNQPGHTFFKKWGQLESPLGQPDNKSRGHLLVDLSIVSKSDSPVAAIFESQDYDDIEKNLLQPNTENSDVENVRHYVTIHKGMFMRKADYIVQVSFAGFHAKTKVAKGCTHPEWNEQYSFSWVFPSLCRTFSIQVLANEFLQWKCISNCEVHFDEITFPGNLPTFGPSFLHLFDSILTTNYIGRIMISIKTERLQKHLSPVRCIVARKIPTLTESTFWSVENFVVVGLIWMGDFIHANSSNLKIGIRCGEWCSNLVEAFLTSYNCSNYKHFKQDAPQRIIRLSGFFPDNRLKFETDNVLNDLVKLMRKQLQNYRLFEIKYDKNVAVHAKCLRSIISSFIDHVHKEKDNIQYTGLRQLTDWDKQRIEYITGYLDALISSFEQFRNMLKSSRKNYLVNVGHVYSDLNAIMKDIEGLVGQRLQDLWPDLILQATSNGISIAVCRLNPVDYMFSQRANCTGRLCGKRNTMVLKSINCRHTCRDCGCYAGKVDGWIWIGTETEYNLHCNPEGWNLKETMFYEVSEENMFNCQIYIHQAKIRPGNEKITGECSAHARLTFLDRIQETKNVCHTLSPVWNQVVTFEKIILPGSRWLYVEQPMLVAVELFCLDKKGSPYYLGCGILRLSVHGGKVRNDDMDKKSTLLEQLESLTSLSPPPLRWITLSSEGVVTAEVLISGELVEASEPYEAGEKQALMSLPNEICPVNKKYKVEIIFAGFRNFRKPFSKGSAGKYRMKLIFADLSLISGLSVQKRGQSINFDELYAAGLVHLPEQHEYWPPIILTHIQIIKDNKELTIGAAMLSNPYKYLMRSEGNCSKSVTFEDEGDGRNNASKFTFLEMETSFFSESNAETTPLLKRSQKRLTFPVAEGHRWFQIHSILAKLTGHRKATHATDPKKIQKDEYTWWTKFYNSVEQADKNASAKDNQKHHLIIYGSELESQLEFSFLQDWAEPISLVRGIHRKRNCPPKEEPYCDAKCHIEIRRCGSHSPRTGDGEKFLKNASNTRYQEIGSLVDEVEVLVRVYVVQGLRIRSRDRYSESDAYVKLQFGEIVISDRSNYIPNQTNPVFGKVFQMEGIIPREHLLHISLYDRDLIDDLIGCTTIDLEDRLRSKHRACVGISNEFAENGYNMWRDLKSPLDILSEIAAKHDLNPPEIVGEEMKFAGRVFHDTTTISKDERIENRLSLSVLKRLDEIPEIGYKIVPEHVETRSLYRTSRPGIEQGKLQLWVDIFEKDNVPPPIDIIPIPPRKYELRVIVYNTSGVVLDEKNIFGKKMSDIYLRGWLEDITEAQYTDVHYRSLNGEGNFNWRMIFPLQYSRIEDMMVLKRKATIYEQFDTELKVPPVFYLQIWDNDVFSSDDFLGVVNVNLSHFEEPAASAKGCSLRSKERYLNLFEIGVVKGWFPARGKLQDGTIGLTGKVELLMQILTEPEANARPAGLGRNPPDSLPTPNRPETSFNWFTNPFSSLKYILVPQIKKCLCWLCVIILVVVLGFSIIYALPGNLITKASDVLKIE